MTTATARALLLSSRATTTATARRNLVSQTSSSWPSVSMNEISLPLNDGMVLAGQRWTYNHPSNDNSTTTNPQHQQLPNKRS